MKIDLVSMSRHILERIELCNQDVWPYTAQTIEMLAVQFNQAALLQYYYGELDKAEVLLCGAIGLFVRLSRSSPHRGLCLANTVQPLINLARLWGQKGHVGKSLATFDDLYLFSTKQRDLPILDHRLRVTDLDVLISALNDIVIPMRTCRVVEAARVLQTVEDYPELLALVERHIAEPEHDDAAIKRYLLEVRSRALLGMKEYDLAIKALAQCRKEMLSTPIDCLATYPLLSQMYREAGQIQHAAATLTQLEGCLDELDLLKKSGPRLRHIFYRLALERYLLGDAAKALRAAERAFKWCAEWNDQPGSIRCAILSSRISSDESAGGISRGLTHWYAKLGELAAVTYFRLDRACAYWELGLLGTRMAAYEGRGHIDLLTSYSLYRSVATVDGMRSSDSIEQLFGTRPAHLGTPQSHPSIDATFDGLMEYVRHERG